VPSSTPVATAAPTATPPLDGPLRSPNTAEGGQISILDTSQKLQAGIWKWSYYGLSNVTTGSGYSVPPRNGRYLIVLVLVRNASDAPAPIPDGLFVIIDEQGRSALSNLI
ncbi:MAG TPA: hypothetical protein VGW38_14060, partial [Chloroflexota bacterium]|nr:hypothetical protein [Chloroflexota bacterium]